MAARSAAFRVRVEASNKPTVKVDFGDAKGVDLFFKKVKVALAGLARSGSRSGRGSYPTRAPPPAQIAAAWSIFFPEKPKSTPKDDVKKRQVLTPLEQQPGPAALWPKGATLPAHCCRLRMILVADRCGLSPGSMEMMKESVLRALQSFVDVESLGALWTFARSLLSPRGASHAGSLPSRCRQRGHQRDQRSRDGNDLLGQHPRQACAAPGTCLAQEHGERRGERLGPPFNAHRDRNVSSRAWPGSVCVELSCLAGADFPVLGRRKHMDDHVRCVMQEVADGIKFSWTDMDMDPDNKDSVQARFPYGA